MGISWGTVTVKIQGLQNSGLLMSNDRTVRPWDRFSKHIAALKPSVKKSEDALMESNKQRYMAALYLKETPLRDKAGVVQKDELGCTIMAKEEVMFPVSHIEGTLAQAAADTKKKKFKDIVSRNVRMFTAGGLLPFEHNGIIDGVALSPEELWEFSDEAGNNPYVDVRIANNFHAGKIVTYRPVFTTWSLVIPDLRFNAKLVSEKALEELFNMAGEQCGVGTYRKKFGMFEVVSFNVH